MWIIVNQEMDAKKYLFDFLQSITNDRPFVEQSLIVDQQTLNSICREPGSVLEKAFVHCLDAFLINLTNDPQNFGPLTISGHIYLLVLACYNALTQMVHPNNDSGEPADNDPAIEFTKALLNNIPAAKDLDHALAYHAILRCLADPVRKMNSVDHWIIVDLISKSPLSEIIFLDIHTPVPLHEMAKKLLPKCQLSLDHNKHSKQQYEQWQKIIKILIQHHILSRWIIHQWLIMPENQFSCRNTGLLLEFLRNSEEYTCFILSFYNDYIYFKSKKKRISGNKDSRYWPIIHTIQSLVQLDGTSEATILMNRRGQEYFLLFHPLVEIIIARKQIPTEYQYIDIQFVKKHIRPLLNYIGEMPDGNQSSMAFSSVQFEKETT